MIRNYMRVRLLAVVALSAAVIGLVQPAQAGQSTYTYTGSAFNVFGGSVSNYYPEYTTANAITGYIITQTLAPNLAMTNLLGLDNSYAFSFTDGLNTYYFDRGANIGNLARQEFLSAATDANGDIVGWQMFIPNWGSNNFKFPQIFINHAAGGAYEQYAATIDRNNAALGRLSTGQSTGTGFFTTSEYVPAPEPASIALLAVGLAGLTASRRRRG